MPRRPDAHKTGDIAQNAVGNVFARLGWAVEPVKQDYGEDLLVQPAFREEIAHFRIWVQVKGTRKRITRGATVRVPATTALRWARSADPVLLVYWDIEKDTGLAAWAASSVKDWHSFTKPVAIELGEEQAFDEKAARRFGYDAFLRHYARLLLDAHAEERVAFALQEAQRANSRSAKFADEILMELGILKEADPNHVAPSFLEAVSEHQEKSRQRGDVDEKRREGCLLALIEWVNREWGVGVPYQVLASCLPRLALTVCLEEMLREGKIARNAKGYFRPP